MNRIRRATGRWCVGGIAAVALVLGGGPRAAAQAVPQTWVVLITGVSGEPQFAKEFLALGQTFRDAVTQQLAIAPSHMTWLAEDPSADPARITGKCTKAAIDSLFGRLAVQAGSTDRVFVLLIGHGSSQGGTSRFNVPGPDVTDLDFRAYLDRLTTRPVVFVNASSASGDFVKTLSSASRIVLTATKSGAEGNESVFARFFVQAFSGPGADADKDGRVSVLEAFQYARHEVERSYEQANKLLTEHAVLDDDGDGVGHADAGAKSSDGAKARQFYLAVAAGLSPQVASDPRAAELLSQRAILEARIDTLRARKSTMRAADYQSSLEDLLLKLAETNKSLRALEARKP